MSVLSFDELSGIRKQFSDQKIVYASGVYDLTHAGHVLFFEAAKQSGDILVVSVASDELVKQYKGAQRPILNEYIRLKMVSSLKPVDYCFVEPASRDGITAATARCIHQLEPDIYAVNDDAPDIPQMQAVLEGLPRTTLVVLKRLSPPEFENISTTKIIERIRALNNE